jgi:hypothetical protein
LNQWTHIALSRVSGNSRLFVNGVQTGSTYSDSNNYVAPSSDIRIFANAYGGSRSPTGYCSNFRVVKGTGLYSANFTPPTSPLTAITNTQLLTCQSNRFVDNSSNALTVTPYNTYSVQAFSPFAPTAAYDASTVGGSGYFDGSGDVLNFGYSSQLAVGSNDFTIEAWIYKPGSYGAAETIFGQRANNSEKTAIFFFLQNGKLTYSLSADGSSWVFDLDFQSASPVPLNAWTHVAVSRSGSTWRMFINGEVVSTKTYSGSGVTSTTPFTSGGTADNTYYFFNGYISGLRYVVGSAVYTAAFTPPTAPLTAITNTQLLLNFTNAAIIDNTAKNVLETVGNAQISTTQSKFGGSSIYLDGSDVITIPNSEGFQIRSGNFTIEFWYYPETLSVNNAHILDFGDGITGGQNSWNVGFFGSFNPSAIGFLYTYDGSSENKIQDPNVLSTGQWYHIAVVINGTSLVLYKNGVSVASATLSGAIATSNRPFVMGSNQSLSSGYANGYIDDLRITKGIARYTSNFTPQTSQWQDQ